MAVTLAPGFRASSAEIIFRKNLILKGLRIKLVLAPSFSFVHLTIFLGSRDRRPCDLDVGPEVEGMNGCAVVGVIGDLASDPP